MERVLGLLVHPLSHRRLCMSALSVSYVWARNLSYASRVKLPAAVRDELIAVLLLLPFCHSNCRWKFSERISATDATPTRGASVFSKFLTH